MLPSLLLNLDPAPPDQYNGQLLNKQPAITELKNIVSDVVR